nr:GrdX family protein [Tissierella sp.]
MDKNKIVITNNKLVYEKYTDKLEFDFSEDYTYRMILEKVRTKIHEGYELLTHPLSGSVKPNETPYKSIIMSKVKGKLDYQGLNIIEESIMTFDKFNDNKPTPDWTERVLDDFRVIDDSLIGNVITKML